MIPADPTAEDDKSTDTDDIKIIVRSNGTVTYVGKDIAYHLWKFALLGKDFGYTDFYQYPGRHIACGAQPWTAGPMRRPLAGPAPLTP